MSEGSQHMPVALQGSFKLSHYLVQMSGDNGWYGHMDTIECGISLVLLNVSCAVNKYCLESTKVSGQS